jgi:hypothetical protein
VFESLVVTLDIYRRAFARGAALAMRNWPVLGSVFAYSAMLAVGGYVSAFLGLAGGFLLSLLSAACLGSFLYLVEMIVRTGRVSWDDFRRSFGAYLWDVVGVSFALWIFWQLVMPLLSQAPQGQVIVLCIELLIIVRQRRRASTSVTTAAATLLAQHEFIGSNWIEWFRRTCP